MNFDIVYKKRIEIKDLDAIVKKLKDIVGDNWVSTEESDLVAYSKDYQLITNRWTIDSKVAGLPHVVVWPGSDTEISTILKLLNKEKIPAIPYGEGSGVVGGAIPVNGGVMIDMKRFDKIIEINDVDLTVTVECGLNGKTLERLLKEKGYLIGHVPQSFHTSSVGGWIAHRAAGQFSTKYGKIEDILISLRVILPTGEIIDTKQYPRSANGPMLEKLFLGSEGTLGIVTRATLRMWRWPEKTAGVGFAFKNLHDALESVKNILQKQVYPAVVRIYDKIETERHFYNEKRAKNKLMTVFICEGFARLVDFELSIVKEEALNANGVDCGDVPVEHWFETRFDVKEASKYGAKDVIFDTIEVSCMWKDAERLYEAVVTEMKNVEGMAIVSGHASHFYPQGVCFYFTFVGMPRAGKTPEEFYNQAWDAAMKGTINSGGSISHHHGIGITRARWMEKEHGLMLDLMKRIKKEIDPNGIMNPGKLYEEAER
ncbi:MAG: FAD-binding oxidoreductase [Promethearchaeota archaeon]